MFALQNLKALRFGYSQSSRIVASITQRFLSGDPKPSHFPLQVQILCRHFTSEISETQPNVAVNYLINSCGLSPKDAISASKRVKLRSLERADSVLACLRNHGISQTRITSVIKHRSELLQADLEKTVLPQLEFFRSIGVSREDLATTLSYNPRLLITNLENRIVPTYDFLRSLLSAKHVASVFKAGSWIFVEGHSKKVAPNIEVLRESDEVMKMGFNLEKTSSVKAIRALCGRSKLKCNRNREVYRRWGWSEDVALSAFRKNPLCMIHSEKKIMQVMDFFVNKMGWSSITIAKYPGVISFSLEKRIVPRCSVVKVLLLKGLIKEVEKTMSLYSLLFPAEKIFLESFVTKYLKEVPQLLNVYQGKVDVWDVLSPYVEAGDIT
ncbi:hypothetical protein ACFX2I_039911 [Malus domestica]|uniref:transcription termination factor MTEF1, chloroplastic-like n=1 Tax=Malus sylvestris TaxID=3752 RepID=UPI0021AC54E5|nr:transcription termination factor MTEF1, chloroplastic-like [Malus sylvestris]